MSAHATIDLSGVGAVACRLDGRPMREDGRARDCDVPIAEEVPIGFVYNGFPYAVMMASPDDLDDFAIGFSLAEGLIENRLGLRTASVRASEQGIELAIELAPDAFARFLRRRRLRSLRGHTSCGICGVEDLAQLGSSLPCARMDARRTEVDAAAVRRALAALRDFQPLSRMTHCAHAAAWAARDGGLRLVREDVGRHNALDKLIGACLRAEVATTDGFCLVTSRCSYEMVQKAVAARFPALVAISAPTALAIRTARQAGLTLIALDRGGQPVVYSGADGGGVAAPQ
jgi:FdhD protein